MTTKKLNREQAIEITLLVLRIAAGVMFLQAGGLKLFGWFGGMPEGMPPVTLTSQVGIGAILEFIGGLAITLGLFTRPVAFIVSGEMAVAYWQFHAPSGAWPVQNHGEAAVLYCFIFLFLAAYGAGRFSIDAILQRRKESKPANVRITTGPVIGAYGK
jgi:putative oxidoreductase